MARGGTPSIKNARGKGATEMPTTKRRVAVTLGDGEYKELAALAEKHDVSMAWLGRQAILEFLAHYRHEHLQLPLKLRPAQVHRRKQDHAAQ